MRPEHLALGEGDGTLQAEVVVVEPTGADTQVFCKLAGTEVTVLFRDRVTCRPGDAIRLRPDRAQVHLFDAEKGQRLNA